jgi:hypothetical protein
VAKQPAKRRVQGSKAPGSSGRVTPKGGSASSGSTAGHTHGSGRATPTASARYTPPVPREMKVSPWWVPALFFGMLAIGVLIIILNYVELLPTWGFLPDDTSNVWLLVGLALILAGIIVATQWH